ncbi:MAG: SDR family oxidoreductase [Bacteroidia bacterium]|nr:SDR family oxidoreductase [Bacteroidia bacterium]
MKKIMITGANGLLGQKLIDLYLSKPDKKIIATGLGPCRHPEREKFEYAELDISDYLNVQEVFEKYRPDTLIHTAAMTNVDACETDHESCDRLNVKAVELLAEACLLFGTQMIHLSTDFIFDGTHGPVDENEVPKPLSYYGHSKLKGEELVKRITKRWAILRTVLVYGVVKDMSRSNIVLWAKGALEKGQAIKVVDDQFRTPTLAEDLAMGCFLAEDKNAQGIYNISGKDFMSIYELVERVADFYNLSKAGMSKSDSTTLNQAAVRPPITGFIIEKAMKDLGYSPHSFEEGLALVSKQLNIAENR